MPQYARDRRANRYEYRGKLRKQVDNAFSFLAAYAKDNGVNVSPEDLKALAVGFARSFPVVSDDAGICQIAAEHGIECWSMVKLLKVMVTAKRIDMDKVSELLEYLAHENDLPMSRRVLRRVFKGYFGCPGPV